MRALVQRVSSASVSVGEKTVGSIKRGLGVSKEDNEDDARYIVAKTVNLRVFPDEEGRFDRSALDIGAEFLVVSQFTLYGDTRKGRRPSFTEAAPPDLAEPLFDRTVKLFKDSMLNVETGRFQAHMTVSIHNDGPVTIMLDSADLQRLREPLNNPSYAGLN